MRKGKRVPTGADTRLITPSPVIFCAGLSEELNFEKILLPISFLFKIQNSTSIYGLLKIFGFDKSLVMHQSCRLI